ncbi:hypothetical protein ANAPC5_01411 [Anaplasma phagocytophilum]|nr:hypothetical protein ANAPC5_01411 [Anaplasma phagocytophilum]
MFLDLTLEFKDINECCKHEPRSCKGFLLFASGHSKTIKHSVSYVALVLALKKYCHQNNGQSFEKHFFCLRDSGYPIGFLGCASENTCTKL